VGGLGLPGLSDFIGRLDELQKEVVRFRFSYKPKRHLLAADKIAACNLDMPIRLLQILALQKAVNASQSAGMLNSVFTKTDTKSIPRTTLAQQRT
jgi:hypothetical protein